MSIGRFARRAGLSIGALRHYAEIGLLRPARVDPDTGYRYYAEEQLDTARLIARLRDVDVPLALIREVRDAPPDVLRNGWPGTARTSTRRYGGCSAPRTACGNSLTTRRS